jgi:uncharacterized protein YcsI (UPF0317 family)
VKLHPIRKATRSSRHSSVTSAGEPTRQDWAYDVLLFAHRNPKSCPLLGVLEAGQLSSDLLPGGDIRTDIPRYTVHRDRYIGTFTPWS